MDIVKSILENSVVHQLAVSLSISVLMLVGAGLSAKGGLLGMVGKVLTKLSDLFGSNVKH